MDFTCGESGSRNPSRCIRILVDWCRVCERAITALVCRLESISRLLTVVRRGREWKNSIKVRIAVSVADPAIAATVEFG